MKTITNHTVEGVLIQITPSTYAPAWTHYFESKHFFDDCTGKNVRP